ncbi:hypothetical protein STENM327S_00012 [Streptomyces tendae]
MTVTSEPKDFHAEANSTPMTPPPSTIADFGTRSSVRAWSEEMIRLPSISRPGRVFGTEPVASRMWRPWTRWPPTSTEVGEEEPALTLDVGDLAGGDQTLQPLVQAGDHLVLVLVHAGHVDALEGRLDTELLALAGLVGDLARVQQGFGRNATVVQAGAAELVLLDQGDVQAQLCPAQGRGVPTAATAEDH